MITQHDEDIVRLPGEDDLWQRSWSKMERDLQKQGFREGAIKGKEEFCQVGFDSGYCVGFKLGKAIGFSNGSTSYAKQMNSNGNNSNGNEDRRSTSSGHLVHNQSNWNCMLCERENDCEMSSEEQTLADVVAVQNGINNLAIQNLTSDCDMQ